MALTPRALTVRALAAVKSESGSLIPLTSGLFLILLILSMGSVNLGDSFLAKRELIQIAEAAAQSAAHQISLDSYYSDSATTGVNSTERVPIDCSAAHIAASDYISHSVLRGRAVALIKFSCEGDQVTIGLSGEIDPVVSFPIFVTLTGGKVAIVAEVSAVSIFGT